MRLTCPTCNSSLEVPDGTTAHVRCPTCRTVFSPEEGSAAAPPLPPRPVPAKPARFADDDRPRRRPESRPSEEENERPRRMSRREEADARRREAKRKRDEERELEAEARRKRRLDREENSKLSPEDRRIQKAQFARGWWGCKLLNVAFGLYAASMLAILLFLVVTILAAPIMEMILVAGLLGLANWVLGAVGTALCISSKPSPGHYGYGIAAAIGIFLHAMILLAVVVRAPSTAGALNGEVDEAYFVFAALPTQLHILTFYLAQLVYPDENLIHKGAFTLGLIAGVAELIRLMLLMMLVSCVARSAGDEELSHRCTRAAGIGAFGPGALAAGVLLVVVALVETGGLDVALGKIILTVTVLGIYAVLGGMLIPSMVACQETADACEYPGESKLPQL